MAGISASGARGRRVGRGLAALMGLALASACSSVAAQGPIRLYSIAGAGADGFVARETALHLGELTGVPHGPPVVVADVRETVAPCVVLVLDAALGRETYACDASGGRVVIRGGDNRGLYYGTLAFFERLGFRWYAPGADGTVIPRADAVEIPEGWSVAGRPSIPWRGYHICGTGRTRDGKSMPHFDYETALWMARNRMNFKPVHNHQYDEVAPLLREIGLEPLAFGHSFSHWLPDSEFAAHPDYFALIAGKRQPQSQPCLSNPAFQRYLLDRLVEFADAHPDLPIISIAPNDGYRFCQCEGCLAMDSPADREREELNRRNHLFAATMAAQLRSLRPGRRVSTLSYSNYLEPAEDVPREEALVISMCVTHALNRPLDDPESASNRALLARLDRWLARAGQVFWSEYFLSYGGTLPRPYERQTARTIRVLAERGVAGIKSEVVPGDTDLWRSAVFFLYLVARTSYDSSTDPDALLEDFCRRYHGPAWEPCLRYYAVNSKAVARFGGEMTAMTAAQLPGIYSDSDVAAINEAMEEADRLVRGADPVYARRLEPLRRQAREVAASLTESRRCAQESAPIEAPRLASPPAFEKFDSLHWIEQRQRTNLLPYDPPSRFAAGWDDRMLWLCFRLGEPDMAAALARGGAVPADAFAGSHVDCFFSPAPESGVYYQVAVNLRGDRYAARCRGREFDTSWDPPLCVELRHLSDRWELILGVPFRSLGIDVPEAGQTLRLSVNRAQTSGGPRILGGWPDGGSWHRIGGMGTLILAAPGRQAGAR